MFLPIGGVELSTLPQQLVDGLLLGFIYALIALGYTMVYGVLKLINFAHGEVFMIGAYCALFTSWALGYIPNNTLGAGQWWMLIVMLVASMVGCGLLGMTIERFAYRPLRNQPRIASLITAIGLSLLLQYGGQIFLPLNQNIDSKINPAAGAFTIALGGGKAVDTATLKHTLEEKQAAFDEYLKRTKADPFNLDADGKKIRFLNVNARLADSDGKLFAGMTVDRLHPSLQGYQVWADGLTPLLTELLGPPAATDHAPPPTGDPSAKPAPRPTP